MELKMVKNATCELTEKERQMLHDEFIELLEEYDYNPTGLGVWVNLDEWLKNKGWIINLFKKHPKYNGRFQIVFDVDYPRVCDKRAIVYFINYLKNVAREMLLKEVKYNGVYTYRELDEITYKLGRTYSLMEDIAYYGYRPSANGCDTKEMKKKWEEWNAKRIAAENDSRYVLYNEALYAKEDYDKFNNVDRCLYYLGDYYEQFATEEMASKINEYFPTVKAVVGQKTSRIVNKICQLLGLDKDADYNKEFAKYADGINPLLIKKHTIISVNPIDYLTMSFGNSWASCHTIDKANKRDMPNSYDGGYSSGTLSYMLDDSSIVFYTVSEKYDGDEYELQDKIERNMFHLGEDKLVQGRIYPQGTDGETGIYKQFREIVQKVIADCLEVPNMWKNVKGTSECGSVIHSIGTHYRDYLYASDCNVSYLKGDTDEVNRNLITVGHRPICPSCGCVHSWDECIECRSCYDAEVTCYECGSYGDRDNMIEIDGEYFCEDCCFYCDYHEEWERYPGDSTYVEHYGRVCNDALEYSGDFGYCENCNRWYYNESGIETEDGYWYCCKDCASEDGYTETSDGNWYPEDEVVYCEHCDEYVHIDDYDTEHDCCNGCLEEVLAEENDDEEIA